MAGLLLLLCAVSSSLRADDFYELSVTANLTVGGNATVGNLYTNTVNLGGLDGDSYNTYEQWAEYDSGNYTVYFGGRNPALWIWEGYDNSTRQMTLTPNGTLTVFGFAGGNITGNISLDPINGTIAVNGTTFTATSVYVSDYGFAVGNLALANGTRSAAFGGGANVTANGTNSVALADGYVNGTSAVAMSSGNANGNYSLASGVGTFANTTGAIALGTNATAEATGAIALGTNVTANVWSSVTVGHNNANITGCTTDYASKDPAFIVGIGQNNTTGRANGLVVLNNGIVYSGAGNSTDGTTGIPTGNGAYFVWDPIHYNFIAASVDTGSSFATTGQVAIGKGVINNGTGAISIGSSVTASHTYGVAIGVASVANTNQSIAIGLLEGSYSSGGVAIGAYNVITGGTGGMVAGYNGTASGNGVVAIGLNPIGAGSGAVSLGNATSATGNGTIAIGNNITVTGTGSAALGNNLTVSADHALVGGQWVDSVNATSNIIFAVGNGTASNATANAITLTKNGNLTVPGNVTIGGSTTNTTISGNLTVGGNVTYSQAFGDVSMGAYGEYGE